MDNALAYKLLIGPGGKRQIYDFTCFQVDDEEDIEAFVEYGIHGKEVGGE